MPIAAEQGRVGQGRRVSLQPSRPREGTPLLRQKRPVGLGPSAGGRRAGPPRAWDPGSEVGGQWGRCRERIRVRGRGPRMLAWIAAARQRVEWLGSVGEGQGAGFARRRWGGAAGDLAMERSRGSGVPDGIVGNEEEEGDQESVGDGIRADLSAKELHGRPIRSLGPDLATGPFDAVDLVQDQVREIPQDHCTGFVVVGGDISCLADQEGDRASAQRGREAVEHPSMDGGALDRRCQPEPDEDVQRRHEQHDHLVGPSRLLQSLDQQHRDHDCQERQEFANGNPVIAVQIGQHPRDAAESSPENRCRDGHVQGKVAVEGVSDPGKAAEGNVCPEIGHGSEGHEQGRVGDLGSARKQSIAEFVLVNSKRKARADQSFLSRVSG